MFIIKLLKLIYWDLSVKKQRFQYIYSIFRNAPGRFGNEVRAALVRPMLKSCGKDLFVFPGVKFRNIQNITVGDRVGFGNDSYLEGAGGITIGNNVQIAPDVKIWTIQHRKNDTSKSMHDQEVELTPVVIGNNVWLASNVFIMPGAEIGDWCVISAGSVVSGKTVPPYTIMAGNPARKVGSIEPNTADNP